MPQTFQVLRCYKCLTFQVHQTKKSIKWECKVCGEQQSIKRHYGIGIGKDCRVHAQKLNTIKGQINEFKCSQMQRNVDEENETETFEPQPVLNLIKESKWYNYIEETQVAKEGNKEPMLLGDAEVVLEIPLKRKKHFNKNSRNNYYTKPVSTEPCVPHNSNANKKVEYGCSGSEIQSINTNILEVKVMSKIKKENSKPNVLRKIFVPPVIKKNSKWAQFTMDEQSNEPSQTEDQSQNDLMFSLCDDSELDNVLDI